MLLYNIHAGLWLISSLHLQETIAATNEEGKSIKDSIVEGSTNHGIDLCDEEAPPMAIDQQLAETPLKGKRRMTSTNKTRNDTKNLKQQSDATTSDRKLLKVVKQEK